MGMWVMADRGSPEFLLGWSSVLPHKALGKMCSQMLLQLVFGLYGPRTYESDPWVRKNLAPEANISMLFVWNNPNNNNQYEQMWKSISLSSKFCSPKMTCIRTELCSLSVYLCILFTNKLWIFFCPFKGEIWYQTPASSWYIYTK